MDLKFATFLQKKKLPQITHSKLRNVLIKNIKHLKIEKEKLY